MGKKSSTPAAPKPDENIGRAALMQAELGKEWLEFAKIEASDAKDRQALLDDLTQKIGQQQLSINETLQGWAGEDRAMALEDRQRALANQEKYEGWADQDRESSLADRDWALERRDESMSRADADRAEVERQREANRPIEERMRADAMGWDSDERMAEQAAQARADVLSSSAGAQQQQQRQMASMGINPNSGRFSSIDNATAQQAALGAAGAQNQARDNIRQQAVGMRQGVAQYGLGAQGQAGQMQGMNTQAGMSAAGFGAGQYNAGLGAAGLGASVGQTAGAAQGAGVGTYGAAIGAGNSVLGGQQTANQMAASIPAGLMGQGFSGAMQGQAGMASTLNQQYSNQLQAWSANRQAAAQESAGFWGGVGSMAGTAAGFAMMSSKEAKTNKQPVDGSALEAIKGMPVESWDYKPGMGDGGSHIGPYAEDFQAATGRGDGQSIPIQDMLGLQLKAIQELGIKIDQMEGGNNRRPNDIVQEAMA